MQTNSNNPKIAVNDVLTGTITAAMEYGFKLNVTVDGVTVRGLLHKNQVRGKDADAQAARVAELNRLFTEQGQPDKPKAEVEVLVTRCEEVDATNPRLKGRKILEVAFSERALIARRAREARETRTAREESIINGGLVGTEVQAKIVEVREGLGVFLTIEDGIAAGLRGLAHITELVDSRDREVKERTLASYAGREGEVVTATIVKVGRNDKQFLTIGLSLKALAQAAVAAEHAALLDRFPVGIEVRGKVVKSRKDDNVPSDGILLQISQDGVMAVLRCGGDMAGNIQRAGACRVVIEGVDEHGRLTVSKA